MVVVHVRALSRSRVLRRPAVLPRVARWYLVAAWLLFLAVAAIDFGGRREVADPYGYAIGDLADNPARALAVLPVATFVNVGVLQILYVTAILGSVGPHLASRGDRLVAAVFLGSSIVAGLTAGFALHVLDGQLSHRILDEAWERHWNGGSAGCYGLVGLLAAGTRRPWLMLGLAVAWEVGLTGAHLRSYTPAFHISALLTGFAAGRWLERRAPAPAPAVASP
jgi:hypothetical protein